MSDITQTIEVYEKDTPTLTFTIKDVDGDAVDLSGLTIYFSAVHEFGGTNYFEKSCTLTDPVNGICQVTLAATDTTNRVGAHYAELRNVTSGVNLVYEQFHFIIKEAIKAIT